MVEYLFFQTMKKLALFLLLSSIPVCLLFSQPPIFPILQIFAEEYAQNREYFQNSPRMLVEQNFFKSLGLLAAKYTLEYQRAPVAISGRFAVFSEYATITLPGTLPGIRSVHLDLPSRLFEDHDPALALALCAALVTDLSQFIDRPTIKLVVLGGQYGGRDSFGLNAWANDQAGYYPEQLIHVRFQKDLSGLGIAFFLHGKGVSGQGMRSYIEAVKPVHYHSINMSSLLVENVGWNRSIDFEIYRNNDIPLLAFDVPLDLSEAASLDIAYALLAATRALCQGDSSGKHFVQLLEEPLVIVGEYELLQIIFAIFLLLFFVVYKIRNRLKQGFAYLWRHFGNFLLFLFLVYLLSFLSWLLTAGFISIGVHPILWANNPGFGLLIEGMFGLSFFLALYNTRLSNLLPNAPSAYGLIAFILSFTFLLLIMIVNVSLTLWGIALVILHVPLADYGRRILVISRILLSLCLVTFFVLILSGNSQGLLLLKAIRDDVWGSTIGLGSLILLILCSVMSIFTTRKVPHIRRNYKKQLVRWYLAFGILFLVMYLLSLWLLPSVGAKVHVVYQEYPNQTESSVRISSNKPLLNTQLLYNEQSFEFENSELKSYRLDVLESNLGVRIHARDFMGRKIVTINLRQVPAARQMYLNLQGQSLVNIISASKPHQYISDSNVLFFIGPYPPEAFSITLELAKETKGSLSLLWTKDQDPRLKIQSNEAIEFTSEFNFVRYLGELP
jgi:hypothetical protein